MVSSKRLDKLEAERQSLESEYLKALHLALLECADGKWGLFGQNDGKLPAHLEERYRTEKRKSLDRIGEELSELRMQLGYLDDFWPMRRLNELRTDKNSNTLGEAKLATAFLNELNSSGQ